MTLHQTIIHKIRQSLSENKIFTRSVLVKPENSDVLIEVQLLDTKETLLVLQGEKVDEKLEIFIQELIAKYKKEAEEVKS